MNRIHGQSVAVYADCGALFQFHQLWGSSVFDSPASYSCLEAEDQDWPTSIRSFYKQGLKLLNFRSKI